MDFSESTKVVYNRIQKIEPDNVSKIIGYLLLQDHGERDMIRLAFGPDHLIQSLVNKAKSDLLLSPKNAVSYPVSPSQLSVPDIPLQFTPSQFSPISTRPTPLTIRVPTPYGDPHSPAMEFVPQGYSSFPDEYRIQHQLQFLSLDDQLEPNNSLGSDSSNYYYPEPALGPRANRRSPSLSDFPVKVCNYFTRGFCKHGSYCKYIHSQPMPESFSQSFNPTLNDMDDHIVSPGSLEKLEMELTELLKSRRGSPVSIASLPGLYFDMFQKNLEGEGYLTESKRHGKAGYSLTKLLGRLKNSIRLIDRPHGQHSVILAEDIPIFMDYNGERNEHGGIVAGSRQIYLTFPADSTFTAQDVSNYFDKFGPVHDVRIPCQPQRMFGFVTFVFAETVKQILAKGNPHYVCGARVLVKPYREKSRLIDRKYVEKFQHPMCYEAESEFHSMPRMCDNARLMRKKQLIEEHEQILEFERRRLSEMQLAAAKSANHMPYFGYSGDEFKHSEEQMEFTPDEHFSYLLDVLNNGATTEENLRRINTKYNEQESGQGSNLPDSPFASALGSGISAVI